MRWLPLALAFAMTGCGPPRSGPGTGGTVEGRWWILESYTHDTWVEAPKLPAGVAQWLTISSASYRTGGATQTFGGTAELSGIKLKLIEDWATLTASDEFEATYQGNLTAARTFTATEDELLLFDLAGYQVTTFRASATDPAQP